MQAAFSALNLIYLGCFETLQCLTQPPSLIFPFQQEVISKMLRSFILFTIRTTGNQACECIIPYLELCSDQVSGYIDTQTTTIAGKNIKYNISNILIKYNLKVFPLNGVKP